MKNKILATIIVFVFLMPLVITEQQSLGVFRQDTCITLKQTCANCTYINVTSITYPNSTVQIINQAMTPSSNVYYYDFCYTNKLGEYVYDTIGNPDGIKVTSPVSFTVTENGDSFEMSQAVSVIALLGVMGLFLGLGFIFSKEKWKVRSFFFMAALMIGIIILNTVRLMIGTSTNLLSMGRIGVLIGIVVFSFMMLYILIYATKEVFSYYKNKKENRWNSDSKAY